MSISDQIPEGIKRVLHLPGAHYNDPAREAHRMVPIIDEAMELIRKGQQWEKDLDPVVRASGISLQEKGKKRLHDAY